ISSGVEQLLEALCGADAIMEVAARADAVILLPFLHENHGSALCALMPQILDSLPLGQEWDAVANAAQPSHRSDPRFGRHVGEACINVHDGARWIGSAGDRAPDNEDRGAITKCLSRGDHPLLVRDITTCRAKARDYEEAVSPSSARFRNF